MRRKLCLYLFVAVASAVTSLAVDFRSFEWGATEAEVIAAEGTPDARSDKSLVYRDRVWDGKGFTKPVVVQISFMFEDGRLVAGDYYIIVRHKNPYALKYRIRAEAIRWTWGVLMNEYGEPIKKTGHVEYARWDTPTTVIILEVVDKGSEPGVSIIYVKKGE